MKLPNHFLLRILKIKEEWEQARKSDSEINTIHKKAFEDIETLLYAIHQTDKNIPIPDLFWDYDGGLEIMWRKGVSPIKMRVLGNNIVHFDFYLKEESQMHGSCELSDNILLNLFIDTLISILKEEN